MRAIQFDEFGDSEVLKLVDLPTPVPTENELLIAVIASGVNYVDIRERQGAYQRIETKVGGVTLPRTPGLQVSGAVISVGPDGNRDLIGRRVLSYLSGGGYAEYVLASASSTVLLPLEVDPFTSAVLPVQGLTAFLTIKVSAALQRNESILIHGAGGGVGNLAVQIAKSLGAGLIIGTASADAKRALALKSGADVVIDYEKDDWPDEVLRQTSGRGVDVILESIGGEVFEKNFTCLAPFGRHIIFGSTRGSGASLEPRGLMSKSQSLVGFYLPSFLRKPYLIQQGLSFLTRGLADGSLSAHVAEVLPLTQAAKAHRLLEDRKVVGTVLLDPNN